MFNDGFYPTPDGVIEKMLEPWKCENGYYLDLEGKTILEPSAGKGNIVDFISKQLRNRSRNLNIYAYEIEPEFQTILREKNCTLIGSDFLSDSTYYDFDLIIMNPPFKNGDQHLLRAWELLNDGEIVCLLNRETIDNPFSQKRQQLKIIIENHGTVEYLGDCFSDAERKTGVEVAMVRLTKKQEKQNFFENTQFKKDNKFYQFQGNTDTSSPAVHDTLLSYENAHRVGIIAFKELMQAYDKFSLSISVFNKAINSDQWKTIEKSFKNGNFNQFIKTFNRAAWNKVLSELNFANHLTKSVREDFLNKFENHSELSFTKENMIMLLEVIYGKRHDIMSQCIVESFDIMTRYHKKNRLGIEGWKTNDAWRVNRKVILPRYVSYGNYASAESLRLYGDTFSINWSYSEEVNDIDRSLCYISGYKMENIMTLQNAMQKHFKSVGTIKTGDSFESNFESSFFECRFFKKGTLHIKFKDVYLWERFNYLAAQAKGFPIPENM